MTDDPHHELAELARDLRTHLEVQAAWAADQPDAPPPLDSLTSILGDLGHCRRCDLARGRRTCGRPTRMCFLRLPLDGFRGPETPLHSRQNSS